MVYNILIEHQKKEKTNERKVKKYTLGFTIH